MDELTKIDIINNPQEFLSTFLGQLYKTSLDQKFDCVVKIIVYIVWLGITKTRKRILGGLLDYDLGFLCLAVYKAFLPIIQNIRMGYPADAIILMRALMEQIALLGYLDAYREQLPLYKAHEDLSSKALAWAKKNTIENWMKLYGTFSTVIHPKIESTSAHIFDSSTIGEALRESMPSPSRPVSVMNDELFACIIYSVLALDTFNENLLEEKIFDLKKLTQRSNSFVSEDEFRNFHNYLSDLISQYQSQ